MNMIGGIDYPTSGSIIIDGNEIQAMSEDELAIFRRRNLGIVYQFYNLIPTLTAEENIALPWKLDGRKENKERLSEIVNMLGLEKRAKHLPGQMSGGQQQRVSIGRALINEPAFILADEPTGNLDSKTSREILDILKFTNQKYKQTILLVTHDERLHCRRTESSRSEMENHKRRGDEVMKITAQLALSQMKVNKKRTIAGILQSHLQHHLLQL